MSKNKILIFFIMINTLIVLCDLEQQVNKNLNEVFNGDKNTIKNSKSETRNSSKNGDSFFSLNKRKQKTQILRSLVNNCPSSCKECTVYRFQHLYILRK